MARLLLVRHGETALNSSQRYWGKTDVGLGAIGIKQAEQLRDRLATETIDHIYSSELKRTMSTARIIASFQQCSITACPELREIDFGQLEGLNFDEVKQQYPDIARQWIERDSQLEYPGGESLFQLETRICEFVRLLSGHNAEETILITAHSGVVRTLICLLLGVDTQHRWNFRIDLASLSVVETYSQFAILSRLNDVSHLFEGRS